MNKYCSGKFPQHYKDAFKIGLMVLLVVLLTANPVLASGSSGGLVTLRVSVSGLPDNSNITVDAVKEIDGVLTVFTAITDSTGIAEIRLPFGGSAEVSAEAIPGYITPVETVSLTKVKGNFVFNCSLVYLFGGDIPVTGISVSPAEATNLLAGSTLQLTADIDPDNASDQSVVWAALNPAIASVNSSGLVTALTAGNTTITATANDGSFQDSCAVSVVEITGIQSVIPDPLLAAPGSTILLPEIVQADLSNSDVLAVPVVWSLISESQDAFIISSEDKQYISLTSTAAGEYLLEGSIANSELKASLSILVAGDPVVPVESAVFAPESLALYLGLDRDYATLNLVPTPENADTSAVLWTSSNPDAAIVESVAEDHRSAVIRGLSVGYAIITAGIPGQEPLDSCLVTVAVDPLLTDTAYIAATTETDPAPVDQFATSDDVWIRCYNLPDGFYHIKVTDKGTGLPLGTGTIDVVSSDPDGEGPLPAEYKYHLKTAANFSQVRNVGVNSLPAIPLTI